MFNRWIHSIDGWLVRETIRRLAKQRIQVATIHDSFWTCPNDVNALRHTVLEILTEIAEADFLSNILTEIAGGTHQKVVKKNKDLGKLIQSSEYFLS